jgi:preprotein translocase subunit SecY
MALQTVLGALSGSAYTYNVLYMLLIFLFAYFWVTVQFQPREMAKNLRDSGSFIPGLRPGRRTAEYLETVMTRITYFGAAFLAAIAVVPTVLTYFLGIDWTITTFIGGTGLLIVVSVSLDLVQKIEANLLMRSYEGFSSSGRIKGAYA